MAFRVSFFFTQQSSKLGGWSVNFWSTSSDLSVVEQKTQDLQKLLYEVTGAQVVIPSARIADNAVFRRVKLVYFTASGFGGAVTPSNDTDYPSTALQLIHRGSPDYRVLQWLRGIPDEVVSNSGRYNPSAAYVKKIGALISHIVNPANLWGLNVLDRTVTPKVVSALAVTTGILTVPAHGFGANGSVIRVRVKGFSSPKQVNKVWRATVISADTIQLNFWTALADTTVVSGINPTCRLQTYIQVPIASTATGIVSSHYTGRPSNLLGGRRRTSA